MPCAPADMTAASQFPPPAPLLPPLRLRQSVPMRRYEPYEEPQPRRPWTRDELRAAVQAVRAMAADEGAGRDPQRLERQAALATELGRERQAIRTRLANIVHVLEGASLPAPACIPPLPGVGRRVATMILDIWGTLDAAEDMAASAPVLPGRRAWSVAELAVALDACQRMATQEAALGRPLDADESGDVISEAACLLGRRWSETRRVMATVASAMAGTTPACLRDIEPADLDGAEREALDRLQRRGEKKEG